MQVGSTVGVAVSTNDSVADELLSNADIAMYNAKAAGKDRYVVFEPQMQEALRERLRLEADIGRALAQGEFFLEYQPVVALATGAPARGRGAGALAAPGPRRAHAAAVHPARRGVGPHHRARALGAADGVRRLAALV